MRYDAVLKKLLSGDLSSWAKLLGAEAATSFTLIETEFSTISATVDRLIRAEGAHSWLIHIEFQSGYDSKIGLRIVRYSAIIEHELCIPVQSVLILLSPDADGPAARGSVKRKLPFRETCYDEFQFDVLRLWEMPVDLFLNGGLGTLALAPMCDLKERELSEVIRIVKKRIDAEVPNPAERNEIWAAIEILLGARYEESFVRALLKGVANMRESTTALAYIEEGRREGLKEGEQRATQQLILKLGARFLGEPTDSIRQQIESMTDPDQLKKLVERAQDVTSWNELVEK